MDTEDLLGKLDPESPQTAAIQIANHLRAAIKTKRLRPGDSLPSNKALRDRYEVARETVKRAIEILERERLIVTQQGKSPRVRAALQRAVELRPHLEDSFRAQHVTLDFAGFSGETLRDSLGEILDKVRMGQYAPETVSIRILVPDTSQPLSVPSPVSDSEHVNTVRDRMSRITTRSLDGITDHVNELYDLGLLRTVTLQIRTYPAPPLFKAYLINEHEVFFGFYPVTQRTITAEGEQIEIFDAMGKDTQLMHFVVSDDDTAQDNNFVDSVQTWFDSVWNTIAHDR